MCDGKSAATVQYLIASQLSVASNLICRCRDIDGLCQLCTVLCCALLRCVQ